MTITWIYGNDNKDDEDKDGNEEEDGNTERNKDLTRFMKHWTMTRSPPVESAIIPVEDLPCKMWLDKNMLSCVFYVVPCYLFW